MKKGIIVLIIIILVAGGWYFFSNQEEVKQPTSKNNKVVQEETKGKTEKSKEEKETVEKEKQDSENKEETSSYNPQEKARDSRIISAVSEARTVLIYYSSNNNGNISEINCDENCNCTPSDLEALCSAVVESKGVLNVSGNSEGKWRVSSQLNEKGKYYCAESTGKAGKATSSPSGKSCPSVNVNY